MTAPSSPPPVRALLFDIGNVLLKFDFSIALAALAEKSGVRDPVVAMARIDQVKAAYEDGQIDRAGFLRAAFDQLGYRGSEAEFVCAWRKFSIQTNP